MAALLLAGNDSFAGDEHWSRQFAKPQGSTRMAPNSGMSDGFNKPVLRKAKWHEGRLWISGAWELGADAWNSSKRQGNLYWYLWTYSEQDGWRAACWFGPQGGQGPDGKINDFLWLPDGRLVVAGEFKRIDNPGGVMYHRVGALAIYDPKEPTANKWRPLGSFQKEGTVSAGGSIKCLAYDAQSDSLYIGGSFQGLPGAKYRCKETISAGIHRYSFKTQSYEPLPPGVYGAKPIVHKIQVDSSTKPSTIYVGGAFTWLGGNGKNPMLAESTSRYSNGFGKYQEGKGWTWYPKRGVKPQDGGKASILQRAGDFKYFDSVQVLDFLVDGQDIWIVGAFSEGKGSGQTLRGIAKWDEAKQQWMDPTGKGGVGREVYSIAKADNGKLYFAGSFGGRTAKGFYKGFNNGDKAHLAMCYDPKAKTWEQLGSGLGSRAMPECRLTVNGNDVYFIGDFNYIGGERTGKNRSQDKAFESWYVARWNEGVDFTKAKPKLARMSNPKPHFIVPTKAWSTGNEHWSRAYPIPPRARGKNSSMSAKTGMDFGTGAPNISGIRKHGDTLYFCGRWEAVRGTYWYVWSHNPKDGWKPVAWQEKAGAVTGVGSPPKGMKIHGGKLWVYGAISNVGGIAPYDLAGKKWEKLEGKTHDGKPVMGVTADPKRSTPVNDIAFDDKTGDLYMVGGMGYHTNPKLKSPKAVGQVIKRDKNGLYTPLGRALMPENPGKPVVVFDCIYLDKTKSPVDIYIGGTFCYYGETSNNSRMAYNVAKWDHKAQDWGPCGFGNMLLRREIDAKYYPKGYAGLPAIPELYEGFLAAGFPRVRCLTMDSEGNLYAGGTLAVIDRSLPVHTRKGKESFGIAKLDAKTQTWVACTTVGGVSRDVFQMTWLDEGRTQMLLSGGFHYTNDWTPVHGVAVFDIKSGSLSPLGGGLLRGHRGQTISSDIVHDVDGDDWYFGGLFEYVGVNKNDMVAAPIESSFVAHWNGKKNFDPNQGLSIDPIEPLEKPKGFSSKSYKVTITAKLAGEKGTVTWYDRRRDGKFNKKGTGLKYTANVRLKGDSAPPVVYVSVTRNGVEGGKVPVRIPLK